MVLVAEREGHAVVQVLHLLQDSHESTQSRLIATSTDIRVHSMVNVLRIGNTVVYLSVT